MYIYIYIYIYTGIYIYIYYLMNRMHCIRRWSSTQPLVTRSSNKSAY